jgi:hypothetical protein
MIYATLKVDLARWIMGVQPVTLSWSAGTWTAGSVSVTVGTSTVTQTFVTNKNTSLTALAVKIAAMAETMNVAFSLDTSTIMFLFKGAAALAVSANTTGITGSMTITPAALPSFMWMDQNAPRPGLPYVSGKISLLNPIGHDYDSPPTSGGIVTTTGNREFVLMLQAYGANAFQILLEIQRATRRATSLDVLRTKAVIFVDDNGGTKDISAILDERSETRAALDIRMRTTDIITDGAVGTIETVEVVEQFKHEDSSLITLDTITINPLD